MEINFLFVIVAALMPTVVGFIWYNPKVFGTAWMKVNGFTEESLKGGNMAVIMGLSLVFSLMLAFATRGMVIHQTAIYSLLLDVPGFGEAGSDIQNYIDAFEKDYGLKHRSFGHGALHGLIGAIFFVLPLIAINSMFERRGWKYIWIHAGYWAVTLTLMGGILCQFS